jgi:hypothetical protein
MEPAQEKKRLKVVVPQNGEQDVIYLNVGGKKFATSKGVLTRYPDTFGKRFATSKGVLTRYPDTFGKRESWGSSEVTRAFGLGGQS